MEKALSKFMQDATNCLRCFCVLKRKGYKYAVLGESVSCVKQRIQIGSAVSRERKEL